MNAVTPTPAAVPAQQGGFVIPFANQPKPGAFAVLTGEQENLAEGIGASYGVIGYKGKQWSLRYRGETHYFLRPDDQSPINYIDVIILRSARQKSKSFFTKYDPNNAEGMRPLCASMNGITPDLDVEQRQSDACAVCPKNVWYTNTDGRRTRDCTDYKRLAVFILPSQTQPFFGKPLMEPTFLRIPPDSLNDLATFGETMNGQGWHFASFVTRISFDPSVAHPKMTFRPVQALTDAEAPVILGLREDGLAKRITGEDQANSNGARPAIQHTAQPALPAPQPQPQPQPQPAPVTATVIPAQPAPQPAPAPAQPQMIEGVVTGIVVTDTPAPAPAPALAVAPAPAPQQTATDTGAPVASTASLDDRIAKLLNTGA